MPESTLLALEDHSRAAAPMRADGGDAELTLSEYAAAGIDVGALGRTLQSDGAKKFVSSWTDLLNRIDAQLALVRA